MQLKSWQSKIWNIDEFFFNASWFTLGQKKELSIWLATAAQNYIDIQHILGGDMAVTATSVNQLCRHYRKSWLLPPPGSRWKT